MRVRETVELVDDEEAKNDKRSRIGPELIPEQSNNEEYLNNAVAEEIEGVEVLRVDAEILREGLTDVLQQSHSDLRAAPLG